MNWTPKPLTAFLLGILLIGSMTAWFLPESEWQPLQVPGSWEEHLPQLENYDGYTWYRCYLVVPPHWISDDHPRELWTGSITVSIEAVSDVYEIFLNGEQIGGAGKFPPAFEPATQGYRRHRIPTGLLHSGKNLIALRIYNESGPGGFRGLPPVIAGYYQEIVMEGPWEFRTGDNPVWASEGAEPLSDEVVYDNAVDATTPLSRPAELTHGPKLSPEQALNRMVTADDLDIDQVLADPKIAQPISVSFDERGRLWLVEYIQYPWPAGLKMKSRDKYYRAVFDQELPPPPYGPDSPFRGLDRITIHEDVDGDGKFESRKVFIDGLNITTAVLPVGDGVWILSPPQLLFYRDHDGDDLPDGDPEVHLTGFGLEDTHSTASSLTWGPDGWLYGTQGMTVTSRLQKPGSSQKPIYRQGAMIWRYQPSTGVYEIFAEGGGNAFSLEIDSKGRVLTGHNGGNTRGFYFHQLGYYEKGGSGRFGPMSNPHTFGLLEAMPADGPIVRFSNAVLVYDAGVLPDRYHGKLFCADPLHNYLVLAERFPAGSSFSTADLEQPLSSDDTSFRPVNLTLGPDGGVYVIDFYEHYIAHGQNYSGMLDPTSGRVYRLRPKGVQLPAPPDLSEMSSSELINLFDHNNRTVRRSALRALTERKDVDVVPSLLRIIRQRSGQAALEAFWAINLLGFLDEDIAHETLAHSDPHVRRWSVRLIGDLGLTNDKIVDRLAQLGKSETDAEVRAQLAATARKLDTESAMPLVEALLEREEDVDDSHIPLQLWWALEARCETERDAVLKLFERPSLWQEPLVRSHIVDRLMRRFAATGVRRDLVTASRLLEMAPDDLSREKLLAGLEQGLAGRTLSNPPEELVQALAKGGGGTLLLRLRQGDSDAYDEALTLIADSSVDAVRRRSLIEFFGQIQVDRSVPVLMDLLESDEADASLRSSALSALQAYHQADIGKRVAQIYPDLPASVRPAAQALLASRRSWSINLIEAVEAGHIDSALIPREIVSQLEFHNDQRIKEAIDRIWSRSTPEPTEAMQARVVELERLIRSGDGNPHRGKQLYMEHCGSCHRLFDDGGRMGPDLTTYGREDLGRLLLGIVAPSAEIREGFEYYVLTTTDGRTISGFLTDQDEQVVVIRDLSSQDLTISRDQIQQMEGMNISLMPEGILESLSDEEIRDLFAHLQAGQPSPD